MKQPEGKFKTKLIEELEDLFPGLIVLHNDPNDIQGFPDLTLLFPNGRWAVLEGKKSIHEKYQPNQPYYLDLLNGMSFAAMICPENKEAVLYELQCTFSSRRPSRFSRP
jgi:hypothetical protein